MGRGDQKTRQGKIRRGTFGKTRPKQSKVNRARRERAAAERARGGGSDRAARTAVGGAGLVAGAAVLGGLAGA